jgi:hypothetical protein
MENIQGNSLCSLCSYLYPKLAKTCLSFYLLSFFFYKIREQAGGTGSGQWGVLALV